MPTPPEEPDDAASPVPIKVKFATTGMVKGAVFCPCVQPDAVAGHPSFSIPCGSVDAEPAPVRMSPAP